MRGIMIDTKGGWKGTRGNDGEVGERESKGKMGVGRGS